MSYWFFIFYFLKNPESWKLKEKPFTRSIEPVAKSIEEVVFFPCDDEKVSNGITSIGWRGPHISQMQEIVALDLLFTYLTESSISPFGAHFIQKNSICNKVSEI